MQKLIGVFEKFFLYIASACVLAIMLLVTADATSRYLLNHGIFGVYEVSEQFLMIGSVFLAACYAYRGGSFIRVTFLVDHMPAKMRLGLEYFSHLFSIMISLIFLVAAIKKSTRIFASGASLDAWSLPLWPAYVVVVLGFFLLILAMIIDIPRIKSRGSDALPESQEKVI